MNFAIACGIVCPHMSAADVNSIIDGLNEDDEGMTLPEFDDENESNDDLDFLGEEPTGPADHINDLYA